MTSFWQPRATSSGASRSDSIRRFRSGCGTGRSSRSGRMPTPSLQIRLAGPGVIGAIVRRPTLETVIRQYATGGIDIVGADMLTFIERARAKKIRIKPRDLPDRPSLLAGAALCLRAGTRGRLAILQGAVGRRLHPLPLRPRQRILRALSRPGDAVLLRLLHRLGQCAGDGAARQARHDLPQAAPSARRPVPRRRLRVGRAAVPCRGALRRLRARRDALRSNSTTTRLPR